MNVRQLSNLVKHIKSLWNSSHLEANGEGLGKEKSSSRNKA